MLSDFIIHNYLNYYFPRDVSYLIMDYVGAVYIDERKLKKTDIYPFDTYD